MNVVDAHWPLATPIRAHSLSRWKRWNGKSSIRQAISQIGHSQSGHRAARVSLAAFGPAAAMLCYARRRPIAYSVFTFSGQRPGKRFSQTRSGIYRAAMIVVEISDLSKTSL